LWCLTVSEGGGDRPIVGRLLRAASAVPRRIDDRCAIPRNLFSSFHDPHPSKIVQNEYIYKNIIIKYIFQKQNKKYIFKK
jgi:hypothetical protein